MPTTTHDCLASKRLVENELDVYSYVMSYASPVSVLIMIERFDSSGMVLPSIPAGIRLKGSSCLSYVRMSLAVSTSAAHLNLLVEFIRGNMALIWGIATLMCTAKLKQHVRDATRLKLTCETM